MKSTITWLLGVIALCGTCTGSTLYKYVEGSMTMLEQMDLVLEIPYVKKDDTTGSVSLAVENASVYNDGSSLNATYAVLQLQFGKFLVHNVTQTFRSDGEKAFWMEEITFGILHDPEVFKDVKEEKSETFTLSAQKLFSTSLGNSYACNSDVTVQIPHSKKPFNMTFSNMKLQPFNVKDAKFSAGEHCAADPTTAAPETTTLGTTGTGTAAQTTLVTMGTSTEFTEITTSGPTTAHATGTTHAATTKAPPDPTLNNLNVTVKGKNCIMEQMKATFVMRKANTSKDIVVRMEDAVVDQSLSSCGNKTTKEPAILYATFGHLNTSTLKQEFAVNGDKYYYLKHVTLTLIGETGKKGDDNVTFDLAMDNNDTFQVPFGRSLKCDSNSTVKGKTKSKDYEVTMYFFNVRLQAFDIKNNTFNTTSECPRDNAISNIVPIAVGCALAVLVIIVLVAYLIGRRNSSRAGYESV